MRRTLLSAIASCLVVVSAAGAEERPAVIVAVGAPGTPEYAAEFRRWSDLWMAAAAKAGAESTRIGLDEGSAPPDRDRLKAALAEHSSPGREPVWLVLIGHGTFDGKEAKFNLRGPDMTESELADWLAPLKRPLAVLNCFSGSGPFLKRLSGPDRIVVSATRSGDEMNFSRLGKYLAESVDDPAADLDKDGQVSLLEAYLTAGTGVAEYYKSHSQLATEHALLDDNGDKLGTPPDWFRGVRAIRRAKDGSPLDGARAHQLALVLGDREKEIPAETRRTRDELEISVASLREKKETMGETEYYRRLEPLMLDLARLYRDLPGTPPRPAENPR